MHKLLYVAEKVEQIKLLWYYRFRWFGKNTEKDVEIEKKKIDQYTFLQKQFRKYTRFIFVQN